MPETSRHAHFFHGHPTMPGYYQCKVCGLVRTPWQDGCVAPAAEQLPPPVSAASVVEDAPLPVGDPKGWPWVRRQVPIDDLVFQVSAPQVHTQVSMDDPLPHPPLPIPLEVQGIEPDRRHAALRRASFLGVGRSQADSILAAYLDPTTAHADMDKKMRERNR